jgi:hypothetical protein
MSNKDSFKKATEATKRAGFNAAAKGVVNLARELGIRGVTVGASGLEK